MIEVIFAIPGMGRLVYYAVVNHDLPLLAIAPGRTIFVTALSVTMAGQGLEIAVGRRMAAARGSQGTQTERLEG